MRSRVIRFVAASGESSVMSALATRALRLELDVHPQRGPIKLGDRRCCV
jgi:hypothetical protein